MNLRFGLAAIVAVLYLGVVGAQLISVRASTGSFVLTSPITVPLPSIFPTPRPPSPYPTPVVTPVPTPTPTPTPIPPITVASRISVRGFVGLRTRQGVRPAVGTTVKLLNAKNKVLAQTVVAANGTYYLFSNQTSPYYYVRVFAQPGIVFTPHRTALNPGTYSGINFYSHLIRK